MRTHITPRSEKRRETPMSSRAREAHPSAGQRLRHVAVVGNPELEHAPAAVPGDAKARQLQLPDHGARRTHDHDDPEPHPHGDASADRRTCCQQDKSVVVAGLRVRRDPRRDEERRRRTRRQCEALWPELQPGRCRACAPGAEDPRPAAQAEREAGSRDVDDETLRTRVRQANGRARGSCKDDAGGSRRQRHRRPRRARVRRGEREHEDADRNVYGRRDHRPIAVKVTLAV